MEIYCHVKFRRQFKKLEKRIKELAYEKEGLFRSNPFDSRLGTHKLHGALANYWAFWIDTRNRIMFKFLDKGVVKFFEVGDHSIYE